MSHPVGTSNCFQPPDYRGLHGPRPLSPYVQRWETPCVRSTRSCACRQAIEGLAQLKAQAIPVGFGAFELRAHPFSGEGYVCLQGFLFTVCPFGIL